VSTSPCGRPPPNRAVGPAPGAVPREGPKAVTAAQQAAAAKFDSLPPEVRQETLLRRIAEDQAAATASVRSIRTGVWLLVAWFIVLPVLTAIWFMLRS
jgi:hypothetical protein